MRTVEHDGDSYLLVKRSVESSLVRDPETDEELVGAADDLLAVRKNPTTNRSSVERSATVEAPS